jgi:hypothetical protein
MVAVAFDSECVEVVGKDRPARLGPHPGMCVESGPRQSVAALRWLIRLSHPTRNLASWRLVRLLLSLLYSRYSSKIVAAAQPRRGFPLGMWRHAHV